MSLIGEAAIAVKSDTRNFKNDTERGVSAGLSGLGGIANRAGLAMASAVGTGLVGSGVAFAGFQKSMNEVFTLLPGASQDAMDAMSDDVLAFSREFGRLPDEVIPSLYNAISAGQSDDPFGFLETSAMLATAGVADLDTATSALSGAVNAFQGDSLTAQQAADIMFTTVAQGVTTIPELASSLSTVTPNASALGVSMEEVGASVATFTSITGASTAETMTKFNAAMAEALVPTSKLSLAFNDVAGQSIPDFIASGGTLNDALQLLRESTEGNDAAFAQMFGSGEALAFGLTTTGANVDLFAEKLAAMNDSAGATDTAFETMNTGITASWNRLKAMVVTGAIEVGNAIAPLIQTALDAVEEYGPRVVEFGRGLIDGIGAVFDQLAPVFEQFVPVVTGVVDTIKNAFAGEGDGAGGAIATFKALVAENMPAITEAIGKIGPIVANVGAGITAFVELASLLWQKFGDDIFGYAVTAINLWLDALSGAIAVVTGIIDVFIGVLTGDWTRAWEGVKTAIGGVWDFIVANIQQAWNIISTIFGMLLSLFGIDGSAAMEGFKNATVGAWDTISGAIGAAVGFVVSVVQAGWNLLTTITGTAWAVISTVVGTVWNTIGAVVSTAINVVGTVVSTGWNLISTTITTAMNVIQTVISTVWNTIVAVVQTVLGWLGTDITTAWNQYLTAITTTLNLIQTIVTTVWNAISAFVTTALNVIGTVITTAWNTYQTLITTVLNAIELVITTVWNAVSAFISTTLDTILTVVTTAWNTYQRVITTVLAAIEAVITTVWNAISGFVSTTMATIQAGITTAWNTIQTTVTTIVNGISSTLTTVWNTIKTTVTTTVNTLKTSVTTAFTTLKTTVLTTIEGLKTDLISKFNTAKTTVTTTVNTLKSSVTTAFNNMLTPIQNLINKIQAFIDKIKAIPSSIPTPSIPNLGSLNPFANGVYADKAMAGIFGEAGPEVIMPLTRPGRMRTLAQQMPANYRQALAAAVTDVQRLPTPEPVRRPTAAFTPTQATPAPAAGAVYTTNVNVAGIDPMVGLDIIERRMLSAQRSSGTLNGAR